MHHSTLLSLFTTVSSLTTLAVAGSDFALEKRACVGTITKFEDVTNALKCTTVRFSSLPALSAQLNAV